MGQIYGSLLAGFLLLLSVSKKPQKNNKKPQQNRKTSEGGWDTTPKNNPPKQNQQQQATQKLTQNLTAMQKDLWKWQQTPTFWMYLLTSCKIAYVEPDIVLTLQ